MPSLETERLRVRPLTMGDLEGVYRLLDVELADAETGSDGAKIFAERERWLRWTILNYEELAKLFQPPYGDRAVVLKQTDELIGVCGFVPCLAPFEQLFHPGGADASLYTNEFGLFYAFSPAQQRRGYATEAARALIEYAFAQMRLERIVATTTHDNAASIRVMEKLGMRVERNPYPDPPWFQVVGILDNVHAAVTK
ncbi:MAG: GNAT family N-acetyltransferase [Acidobacteria bacterium]|nr:GNAT family N-acetyltransferase [Acidobacteriota bacterium]